MLRPAYTLLEVIAASALTGTVLVSSLALLGDAVDLSERVDRQNLMHTLCVSRLEQYLNTTAAQFNTADVTGDFSAEGFSTLRYRVVCSDQGASGGITNRLMALTCTVWHDANGDNAQNAGEASVTLATKVANMALYATEAGG
jgi:hypothetical protein